MKDTLTLSETASLVGKADSTVHDWCRAGLPSKKAGRNRTIATTDLIKWLVARDAVPGSERERLAKEQADKVAMDNAVKRGELIYSDQVAEVLTELAANLVGHMEAIPGRLAGELAGVTQPAVVRTRLREELRAVRGTFAQAADSLADKLGKGKAP